jgi:hypothetical protein
MLKATQILTSTLPVASVLLVSTGVAADIDHEATYHPDQLQPPAGLEHLYAYRPACRQLESRGSEVKGWTAWGLRDERGKFMQWYGLLDMPDVQAYQYLDEYGLCVFQGAIVEMLSPVERDRLLVETNATPETPATTEAPTAVPAATPPTESPLEANRAAARALRSGTGGTEVNAPNATGGGFGLIILIGAAWIYGPALRRWAIQFRSEMQNPTAVEDERSRDAIENAVYVPDPHERVARTALQIILASPYLSRAFFGGQSTGKTKLAAIATRILKSQGIQVYHLNLASFGGEDSEYWKHADSLVCDLNSIMDRAIAKSYITDAVALVKRFAQHQSQAVLVVDEWSYIASTHNPYADLLEPLLKLLSGQISGLASSGMKREKGIYTIAPEIVAGTLTGYGKAVKKLALCLVAIAPDKAAAWKGQTLTFDHAIYSQVKDNYSGVFFPNDPPDVDRIAFIDGDWLALGTENIDLQALGSSESINLPEDDGPVLTQLRRQIAVVSQQFPGLDTFVEWLNGKPGETIEYDDFRNSNKCKNLERSQRNFMLLINKACALGLVKDNGNDTFFVLP